MPSTYWIDPKVNDGGLTTVWGCMFCPTRGVEFSRSDAHWYASNHVADCGAAEPWERRKAISSVRTQYEKRNPGLVGQKIARPMHPNRKERNELILAAYLAGEGSYADLARRFGVSGPLVGVIVRASREAG